MAEEPPSKYPPPFQTFSPCEVLQALFPDYDQGTEKSASAGGTVRIDNVSSWPMPKRTFLAVSYYVGEDAEAQFVCGQCRVTAHLALFERHDNSLSLVQKLKDPWHPEPKIDALFNGRAEFDKTPYPLSEQESLLAVRRPWSTGMPGTWTNLTLYRWNGTEASIVFEYGVDWWANGMGTEEDDQVSSQITLVPSAKGLPELRLETTEKRCHYDTQKDDPVQVCGKPQPLGQERWKFDGSVYRRIAGRPAPLPRILHKLWHW